MEPETTFERLPRAQQMELLDLLTIELASEDARPLSELTKADAWATFLTVSTVAGMAALLQRMLTRPQPGRGGQVSTTGPGAVSLNLEIELPPSSQPVDEVWPLRDEIKRLTKYAGDDREIRAHARKVIDEIVGALEEGVFIDDSGDIALPEALHSWERCQVVTEHVRGKLLELHHFLG